MMVSRIAAAHPRTVRFILLALMLAALSLIAAIPASASIEGNFCEVNLPSGASCHSPVLHHGFTNIEGGSLNGLATCVGVDTAVEGGNLVNVCNNFGGVSCLSQCTGFDGHAYVHNHDQFLDMFFGIMKAAS